MESPKSRFTPAELKRSMADDSPMEAWESVREALKPLPQAERNEFVVGLYAFAANPRHPITGSGLLYLERVDLIF